MLHQPNFLTSWQWSGRVAQFASETVWLCLSAGSSKLSAWLCVSCAADWWSLPGGSDPEHHHLAHVHGEGFPGALADVQRHGAQRRRVGRRPVNTQWDLMRFPIHQYNEMLILILWGISLIHCCLLPSVRQRVYLWEDVLPAAPGHAAVPVLPEAQAGVRREGRSHQGRDGDRKAGHRVEDQPGRARAATDQPAAENGMSLPRQLGGVLGNIPGWNVILLWAWPTGSGVRGHPAVAGDDPRHHQPGGAFWHHL